MVSISADPRHLTEEKFIIYLINNSSCTSLTLSDLKMTALPSFSTATLGTRHSKRYERHGLNEHVNYSSYSTSKNTRNSFRSHQHQHIRHIRHFLGELKRYQSKLLFFSYLNGFCLTLSCLSALVLPPLFSSVLYHLPIAKFLSLPFPCRFSGLND